MNAEQKNYLLKELMLLMSSKESEIEQLRIRISNLQHEIRGIQLAYDTVDKQEPDNIITQTTVTPP